MRKTSLIAIAPACLLLGACGSNSPKSASDKDPGAAAVRFAQCMRAGGIKMPDPGPNGNIQMRITGKISPQRVEKLQAECQKKSGMPEPKAPPPAQQKEMQDAALKFAACMRSHGVDMPDPKFDGGKVTMMMKRPNLSAPRVQQAQQECQKSSGMKGPGGGPGSGSVQTGKPGGGASGGTFIAP